jgi:hypothetical protein
VASKAGQYLAHEERADHAALGMEAVGEGVAFGRGGWRVTGGGRVQRRNFKTGNLKTEGNVLRSMVIARAHSVFSAAWAW